MGEARVYFSGGIWLKIGRWRILIDPVGRPVEQPDITLFTHGHIDHISGAPYIYHLTPMFASGATKRLIEIRYPRLAGDSVIPLPLGFELRLGDLLIKTYNAGHIVGSVQYLIEHRDVRIGVTGDLNMVRSLTERPAELLADLDLLVIEATYGSSFYVFPDRDDLYAGIERWAREVLAAGGIPVLVGYALGKAQELTALSSRIIGIKPYVTREVERYNRVFESYRGVRLGWRSLKNNAVKELKGEDSIIVTSSRGFGRLKNLLRLYGIRYEPAYFSGWALSREYPGRGFPLSSHADYRMLMGYIEDARPRKVLTVYGFRRSLAGDVRRKLGIEAEPIEIV